ncbi:MAG: folylpolyglutamate synthase/dihydrofolate synthase family protein [Chloroflexota bacterium]
MAHPRYAQALDYLYSFVDYSLERSYRYTADRFDLDRLRQLLQRLGDPHRAYASLHIAGTKGKGSVSALAASTLKAAGYCTGLYTSPHLVRLTERIRVDGEEIAEAAVVDLVDEIKPKAEGIAGLTMFELLTALGFLYFARQGVDIAVIEVGLGGRLDATNVVTPLVSVITSLSYDHMHLLGNSLSDIAREKAGIIKPGVPVVLAPQQHEAARVVEQVAREQGAPLIRVGRDWLFAPGSHDLERQSLYIWSSREQALIDAYVESSGRVEWTPPRYEVPLLGYHQVINAAVAHAALQVVRQQGFDIEDEAIRRGFRSVSWPGRFQILSRSPVVLVDSAHNRDSALRLRIALDDYFPGKPVTLVFGALADKDIPGMLAELLPRVSRLILTQADHPRAATVDELAEIARGYGWQVSRLVPVSQAMRQAVLQSRPGEVIVAAGSLTVAGEVLASWNEVSQSVGLAVGVEAA